MKMEIDNESPYPVHLDLLSSPGSVEFSQYNRVPEKLVENGAGDLSIVRQNHQFSRQYAHTYFIRLCTARPVLEDQIKKLWRGIEIKKIAGLCESSTQGMNASSPKKSYNSPKKYSLKSPKKGGGAASSSAMQAEDHGQHITLREDVTVAIIGTVFKQQPEKPSILQELVEEIQLTDRTVRDSYISDKDVIQLEDETTRVRLVPASKSVFTIDGLVNGIVLGVKGRPTIDGKFEVEDVIYATPGVCSWPERKYSERAELVVVSGVDFGQETENSIQLGLLFEHLQGLCGSSYEQENVMRKRSRVFFLGNSIKVQKTGSDQHKITSENFKKLDRMLSSLAQTMEVFVITGKDDPVQSMYPQPPMHKCLFPNSTQYPTFHLLSNPTRIQIPLSGKDKAPNLDLILTDGEPIVDAMRFSNVKSGLEMGKKFLEWGHICPTAPDTLPLYPGAEDDVFIIKEKLPNFFFLGNQKSYGSLEWNGSKVVSVPRFSATGNAVVITKDFQPIPIEFNLML